LKEIYDCHLDETKERIFGSERKASPPEQFLGFAEVTEIVKGLKVEEAIFMGMEPTLDPELPLIAKALHHESKSYNILLTNGFKLPSLKHVDEVVFSIKAYTDGIHRDYTGRSNRQALTNFQQIACSKIRLQAESIFIPEYIDLFEIERIAQFIAEVDRDIPYRIDAYLPVGDNPWRRPTAEEMEEAVKVARKHLAMVSCLKGNEELKYGVERIF
jgi:pyruvate-formate lyase-activating enzyme